MNLAVLPGRFAVARLRWGVAVPAPSGPVWSVTRRGDELSVVCAEEDVPPGAGVVAGRGFRALEVAGPMELDVVGVLASLTAPLAAAGIALFAVSTYDTDLLLVREADLDGALSALRGAGHAVSGSLG